jgi:hypothetical protein
VHFQGADITQLAAARYTEETPPDMNDADITSARSGGIELPYKTLCEKTGSIQLSFCVYLGLPLLAYITPLLAWILDHKQRFGSGRDPLLWPFAALIVVAMVCRMVLLVVTLCAPSCMTLFDFFWVRLLHTNYPPHLMPAVASV